MTTVGRSPVKNAREPVCELLSWRLLLKGSIGNEGNYIQVVAGLDVGGADASQLTVLTVEVVIIVVMGERILDRLQLHVPCFFQGYLVQVKWFVKRLIGRIPGVFWGHVGC